jgi:nucleoside-diphosphate-sugar epimerase
MKALVTGGGGFVGGAIVRQLVQRGDAVTSVSRGHYPALEALGVTHRSLDLADTAGLVRAMEGCEVVFHCAAKAGIAMGREPFQHANVTGTQSVLDAARRSGVKKLIFTSSPSVAFDGSDHRRASNDLPYAPRFLAPYPASKAQAERLVLAANDSALATVALRPHLVFGAGDPHLVPRLIERARAGQLAIVGRGDNEVSLCHVTNAASAHLAAADRLGPGAAHAGKAYFIAQTRSVRLWDWIAELLRELNAPLPRRRIPLPLAYLAGIWLENFTRPELEPRMSRFLALQLASSHSYDMEPARRDFGYAEQVSMEEATQDLLRWARAERL